MRTLFSGVALLGVVVVVEQEHGPKHGSDAPSTGGKVFTGTFGKADQSLFILAVLKKPPSFQHQVVMLTSVVVLDLSFFCRLR